MESGNDHTRMMQQEELCDFLLKMNIADIKLPAQQIEDMLWRITNRFEFKCYLIGEIHQMSERDQKTWRWI